MLRQRDGKNWRNDELTNRMLFGERTIDRSSYLFWHARNFHLPFIKRYACLAA